MSGPKLGGPSAKQRPEESSAEHAGIQRIGLNLGAPGDRMTEAGTLWLDYPVVGGPSPSSATSMAGPVSPLTAVLGVLA